MTSARPYRQVHADIGPVQEGHSAGDDGPRVPGRRDVRGCTLGLAEPVPLGLSAHRPAAERSAEEAQHFVTAKDRKSCQRSPAIGCQTNGVI